MQIIDFLDRGAQRYPDRPLLIEGPRTWTYRDIEVLTHRIANALHAADAGRDCHFATYSPNHAMAFAAQYGGLRAGGIWIPTTTRNSVEENGEILATLDTEWLFFHSQYEADIERIKAAVPTLRGLVCIDARSRHGPSLEEFIEGSAPQAPVVDKGPLGLASLFSTGGTTGRPKGVELTHLSWATLVMNMQAAMPYTSPPVHLVVAPLTHAAGALTAALLSLGGTQVLLPKADPALILEAIPEHGVTTMFMPPTLIYMLLACPTLPLHDYRSLKYFVYGAAPMSVQKLREAMDAFGPVLCQVYGQTEALMAGTFFSAADHVEALQDPRLEKRLGSAGRAFPYTVVEIMDDHGRLCDVDEPGEVVIRGNTRMAGYYKNPEATAAASQFGWHHTGDIGTKDRDGFLHIVDRKKDMIISGGFNVFPSEVEQVLLAHPAVQDCAVIGVPHEKWGEAVTAVVQLKPGCTSQPQELIDYCKSRLGGVKAPKAVHLWESLPRSNAGKVLKREIRDQFWSGKDRMV